MPEVTIAAGGIIDLASKSDLDAHHERIGSLLARPSVHGQRVMGFTNTGTGPLVIDLGAPPMGMIWVPQDITVMGADPFLGTANAFIANVSAAVFAGSAPRAQQLTLGPPVTGGDFANCIEAAFQIPQTIDIPATRKAIMQNEHMYVILAGTGLAAGSATVYRAVAWVLEVPFSDTALSV